MATHFTTVELRQLMLAFLLEQFAGAVPDMSSLPSMPFPFQLMPWPLGVAADILEKTKPGVLRNVSAGSSLLELVSVTSATGTGWQGVTNESLLLELDHQVNHRSRTAELARERLHELALAGETAEYGVFMADIKLSWKNPHHRRLTGELLGQISTTIFRRSPHHLLPSVLVVNKATQRPSQPFFQLGRDYKAYDPGTQSDADFFNKMKAKVFANAKSTVWKWSDEMGA